MRLICRGGRERATQVSVHMAITADTRAGSDSTVSEIGRERGVTTFLLHNNLKGDVKLSL
jgi:hypothetical protein